MLIFWPTVQKLHDHHSVLWKKSIWRRRGCCRCLQNSVLIRLVQPGGSCLTCTSSFPPPPSVPAHLETHQHHAALRSSGQSSRLTSPCVLTVVAQLHLWWVSRASMCIFNPLNHGECSAGFTESTWLQGGVDRVMIQLNTLQAPHYPETLDRSKSNTTDHTT